MTNKEDSIGALRTPLIESVWTRPDGKIGAVQEKWPNYSKVRFTSDRHREDGAPATAVGYIVEVYEDGYEVEVSEPETGRTIFIGGVLDADLELISSDEPEGADPEDVLLTLAAKFIADVEATTPLRPTCSVGQSRRAASSWERKFRRHSFTAAHPELVSAMLSMGRGGMGASVERSLIHEHRFAEVLAYIADEWSELVGEELVRTADVETARTWPKCALHGHAMDPIVEGGRAWWACREDSSVRVPIGELTPP